MSPFFCRTLILIFHYLLDAFLSRLIQQFPMKWFYCLHLFENESFQFFTIHEVTIITIMHTCKLSSFLSIFEMVGLNKNSRFKLLEPSRLLVLEGCTRWIAESNLVANRDSTCVDCLSLDFWWSVAQIMSSWSWSDLSFTPSSQACNCTILWWFSTSAAIVW